MTLQTGFRGTEYDDKVPLFCTTKDGWVMNSVTRKWFEWASLNAAAEADGHKWGSNEVGIPPESWQKDKPFAWGPLPGTDEPEKKPKKKKKKPEPEPEPEKDD